MGGSAERVDRQCCGTEYVRVTLGYRQRRDFWWDGSCYKSSHRSVVIVKQALGSTNSDSQDMLRSARLSLLLLFHARLVI